MSLPYWKKIVFLWLLHACLRNPVIAMWSCLNTCWFKAPLLLLFYTTLHYPPAVAAQWEPGLSFCKMLEILQISSNPLFIQTSRELISPIRIKLLFLQTEVQRAIYNMLSIFHHVYTEPPSQNVWNIQGSSLFRNRTTVRSGSVVIKC